MAELYIEGLATDGPDLALWELTDPDSAAQAACFLYGASALTAIAWCALAARYDGRPADYRFWLAAFLKLRADAATPVSATGSC